MEQLSIDCIAQHLKVLHEQAVFDKIADFGEPCRLCRHMMKECRGEWLTRMKPVFDNTDIQVRLCYPLLPDTKDNTEILAELREDTLAEKNSGEYPCSKLQDSYPGGTCQHK